MNDRTRERILMAAHQVEAPNIRAAAALGGVVRSLMDLGNYQLGYATQAANGLLRDGSGHPRPPITSWEVEAMRAEFVRSYTEGSLP